MASSRLALLSTDEVARVAKAWATLILADASGIKAEFARKLELARPDSEWMNRLRELCFLAKRAVASGKDLFVWITV